jgi:hypothetical protein
MEWLGVTWFSTRVHDFGRRHEAYLIYEEAFARATRQPTINPLGGVRRWYVDGVERHPTHGNFDLRPFPPASE